MPASSRPPIRVWLLALVWAGLTVLLLSRSWLMERLAVIPSAVDFNFSRLASPPGSSLRVVALGTSKTRHALPFDNHFPSVQIKTREVISFQRFSAGAANFNILEPALTALLESPPDVLLLESDLLLYDRKEQYESNLLEDFRNSLQLIVVHIRDGLLPQPLENYGADTSPSKTYCLASRTPQKLSRYAQGASSWEPTTKVQRLGYLEVLRRLREQGTIIVLLDLPRAPHASRLIPPGLDLQVSELRKQLQTQEGFAYWSPGALADELYCDQGHLNRAGRKFYTAWLSQYLADWRRDREQP